MADGKDIHARGDRIERLLDEVRAMTSPPAWQRVEELVRSVVDLYGEGLGRIVDVVATPGLSSDAVAARLLGDKLIESLFLVHGLHPEDFATRVGKALVRVRPYLGSHGGDVELVRADEASGEVKLRLAGSCEGCPSSLLTVKLAVEDAIREAAPEVTRIEVEGMVGGREASAPAAGDDIEVEWMTLSSVPALGPGSLVSAEVAGAKVVLCRVGDTLYAYRDRCPSCGATIDEGALSGDLLSCPSCAERYDVRLAGRSIRRREMHLDPCPLLQDERGIRIALRGAA